MRVYNSLERMFYQFNPSYKERIRNIWDYLEYRVPPQFNWMPESVNDPIIIEAFDKYWPVDEKNQIQKT